MEVWQTFVDYVAKVKPRVVLIVGGGAHLSDPTEATWENPVTPSRRKTH